MGPSGSPVRGASPCTSPHASLGTAKVRKLDRLDEVRNVLTAKVRKGSAEIGRRVLTTQLEPRRERDPAPKRGRARVVNLYYEG
jgi:hypothetical protein